MNNTTDLTGRTCLVTGATSGHGEAVARALARMRADVVLLGRSTEKCRRVHSAHLPEAGAGRAHGHLPCLVA